MRLPIIVSVLALLASTCSSTPAVIPTKNLEHPSDMTFVCVKEAPDESGTMVLSGQPMDPACHTRGANDPTVTLSGQRNLGTFAFVANPGRNEIAVADMDTSRLLDLTPDAPGYGMLPSGGDPESIASTQDGCWVATANRTSCDFTLIDPARLLAPTFSTSSAAALPATGTGEASRRIAIKTASGRALYASTGEIAFLPTQLIPGSGPSLCRANAMPRAVVTFPGCDMVALLDFSFENQSATIASAYYVHPDLPGGFLAAGAEPVCPNDCEPPADATGMGTDAGSDTFDGGAGSLAGVDGGTLAGNMPSYLQPLALAPDGTRVYVGSLQDTAITSLDIGAAGLANPARLNLAEDPIGVSRLRLAIDPYGTVTAADGTVVRGRYLENRGRFLYAVTRDDSIRVVDIGLATPVECDANTLATSDAQKVLGCIPVGSAPRRPLAQGPGIRIPTFSNPDSPPPIPRDVAFADLQPIPTDGNVQSLSGQFGFVVASSGQVYVINLAPIGEDGMATATDGTKVSATATHSFREARDVGKWARTPLAVSIAPQRQVIISDQAFPTTATYSALDGPLIKSFSPDNGTTTDWLDYPDPDTLISRSWTVIWEGSLPFATRASGIVQSATDGAPAGVLIDNGADFCTSGAQPGDVLMFSGCTQNSDCQPDDQFTCQVAVSGARGMCLPISAADSAKLIDSCSRFMGSRMRYEIAQSTQTSLRLQLKLDEVPKTKLNPCTKETQEADCSFDVDHGKLASASPDGGVSRAFECVQVRPPEQEPPRCVKRCSLDSDCRAGHVCESVPGTLPGAAAPGTGFCVEAPPLDAGCFPSPSANGYSPQPTISYSVRAGHSFMVYGASMPSLSSVRAAADGTCQPQAPSNPSLVARIPLSAPKCPASFLNQAAGNTTVPAVFVQNLAAQAGSNPCLYQGSAFDGENPGSIEAGAPGDHIRAFFQNPQIRFVLTNLEQYAGDLLALHFELQYGYVPLTVQIPSYEVQVTMGTRIVVGSTQTPESPARRNPPTGTISYPYLYVVDQGRTALTPGSRGQVLRINPRAGSSEIASFDTAMSGSTPFQLQ